MVNFYTFTLYVFIVCLYCTDMRTCTYASICLSAEMHFFSYFCSSMISVVNKVSGHFFFFYLKKNNKKYIYIYLS